MEKTVATKVAAAVRKGGTAELLRRTDEFATNGAAVIHDFEIALSGGTSEDVDEALGPGRFGMADETGRLLNAAIAEGVAAGRLLLDGAEWGRKPRPTIGRGNVDVNRAARLAERHGEEPS